MAAIDLEHELTFSSSFRFPLQSKIARKEVLWGGFLLLALPGIGWLLNMGHRIRMVHRMQHGMSAWPAWNDYGGLFRDGLLTFIGMVYWHTPGAALMGAGFWASQSWLIALGAALWVAATVAVPGYMTHYCVNRRAKEIFSPILTIRRVAAAGRAYWRAWAIAVTALLLSFAGLLGLGVFFFATSVWFWQVAGFSFATVFSQHYALVEASSRSGSPH